MQVFFVESLYCRENATKKASFRRLVCNTHLQLVPFCAQKGTSISPQACIFLLTHLLACSFLCIKRNKLLTHHMLIPSHYLPLSLFLFYASKGTSLTKACIFFYTPTITIKAQPLWIVPPICETYFTFSNCTKQFKIYFSSISSSWSRYSYSVPIRLSRSYSFLYSII